MTASAKSPKHVSSPRLSKGASPGWLFLNIALISPGCHRTTIELWRGNLDGLLVSQGGHRIDAHDGKGVMDSKLDADTKLLVYAGVGICGVEAGR